MVDAFFFIPKSLQINKGTYNKEQFFYDLHNRIRFKTPKMFIKDILDDDNILSPLSIIKKALNQSVNKTHIDNLIQRELRILASIIKTSLKDKLHFFLRNYKLQKKISFLLNILEEYILIIREFKDQLINLKILIINYNPSEELNDTIKYSEEYISLQIEMFFTKILTKLGESLYESQKNLLIQSIENEQSYRIEQKSRLIIDERSDNEAFIYHEGIMKKYVQGVLYLKKKEKKPQETSLELFYSIGAGLAMFISLFFGIFLYSHLEEYSLPFIGLAVVVYTLRDRIKDHIRKFSQKAIILYLPDKKTDIMDGFYNEKIGICREKMYFPEINKIPKEILDIRKLSNKSSIETEGKPEVCLAYRKKITLSSKKINKMHTRHKDILDITKFNIHYFLHYADDPYHNIVSWRSTDKKLEKYSMSKVYHLNIIFKLTSFGNNNVKEVLYQKYRIILNQNGIKKVLAVIIN
ncbi:MAG: hypothetical protein JXA99_15835 [Candidatus Lokiarchaeota archaeon]|nr:hypothetical protein [Candidatus Lokiarchaeota archaeon]